MRIRKRAENRWIAGLFIILYLSYYSSVSLFTHTHIINGVTIVHSHFHGKAHHSNDTGGHTWSQLELIALAEGISYTDAVSCQYDLTPQTFSLPHPTFLYHEQHAQTVAPGHAQRGPPSLV